MESGKKIILFDGVCNLCNSWVQWVIRHDPEGRFRFAPLQGDTAQKLAAERHIDLDNTQSIILIDPGVAYYFRSDAALEILKDTGGFWSFLRLFRWLPQSVRDGVYRLIAHYRYRWFGKKEQCMIPTPELQSRFLS